MSSEDSADRSDLVAVVPMAKAAEWSRGARLNRLEGVVVALIGVGFVASVEIGGYEAIGPTCV